MAKENKAIVRLYDPTTRTIREIPSRELSSDCMLADIEGIGEAYVEASKLKPGNTIRHQELPEELRKRIRDLYPIIRDVYESSLDKWEEGFKYDTNPDKEIASWERVAKTFQHFSEGETLDQQKAIFEVALKCSVAASRDEVPLIISSESLQLLDRHRVEDIVDFYLKTLT